MSVQEQAFIISEEALDHFKTSDPLLWHLIKHSGKIERSIIVDPFTALVQSIIFQQLAFAAANTIWNRFTTKVTQITHKNVLNTTEDTLRLCGISGPKIGYIKNIAEAFASGALSDEKLKKTSNREVLEILVSIKGIGEWTAEMFLIFCLGRQNIFSYKDLGLRKGVKWLYSLDFEPSQKYCEQLQRKWAPYQSVASLYLWEVTIQNLFTFSPNDLFYDYLKEEPDMISSYNSPVGNIKFVTSKNGLERLEFSEDGAIYESSADTILTYDIKKQLDEYFSGTRKEFDIPLYTKGTIFQSMVWKALSTIKFGETTSYGNIAGIIGNQKASRAVGSANNKNKIAIVIPCHRVIGSGGALTGYAGGLDKKKWLLEHEAKHSF